MATEQPAVPDLISGRVAWIFGDDFDVDMIIGVQNIKIYDPEELLKLCMQEYEADFVAKVRDGDLLVAGRNFGYGHPHYPAMIAMRAAGIKAVVAESFAPGFWRGETFNGMPLITCPGISSSVERWDGLELDWRNGIVRNTTRGQELASEPPSKRVADIWRAGGSLNLLLSEHKMKQGELKVSQ